MLNRPATGLVDGERHKTYQLYMVSRDGHTLLPLLAFGATTARRKADHSHGVLNLEAKYPAASRPIIITTFMAHY